MRADAAGDLVLLDDGGAMSDMGMRQLSREEADLLNICRDLLSGLAKSAQETFGGENAFGRGIIFEACDRGEAAVFEALNCLSSYGEDEEAQAAILRAREAVMATLTGKGTEA